MGLLQTIAPYAEPMDVAEAIAHCHDDPGEQDDHYRASIAAARAYCETYTGRQLVTATWRLTLDCLPEEGEIRLPRGAPVVSVSGITYVDTASATQTLSTSLYDVLTDREPGVIVQGYLDTWPTVRGQANDVAITYVAGHATPFTAVVATDVLTALGRTFTGGERVRLSNSGGALPPPLVPLTDYYVRDVSGSTFKLALTSGGTAINLTGPGTGTNYVGCVPPDVLAAMRLLIGHWERNREAVVTGEIPSTVQFAVEALLMASWVGEYP